MSAAGQAALLFPNLGTDADTYEAFARRLAFYAHAWRQRSARDREALDAALAAAHISFGIANSACDLARQLNCPNAPTTPTALEDPELSSEDDDPLPCWGRRNRARRRCLLAEKRPADPVEAAGLRLIAASAALSAANREIEAARDAHVAAVKVLEDLRAAQAAKPPVHTEDPFGLTKQIIKGCEDDDVPPLKPEADMCLAPADGMPPTDPELLKALEAAARADDS